MFTFHLTAPLMSAALGLARGGIGPTAPSPDPATPPANERMEIWDVSPGFEGYMLGFFMLAVVVYFLSRSLLKHMRRVDVKAEREGGKPQYRRVIPVDLQPFRQVEDRPADQGGAEKNP